MISLDSFIKQESDADAKIGVDIGSLLVEVEKRDETPILPSLDSLIKEPDPMKISGVPVLEIRPIDPAKEMKPKVPEPKKVDQQQNNKKKKANNWFANMIERRGKDYFFSNFFKIDEVEKAKKRILKDIVFENIDYKEYGKYVCDSRILDPLISYLRLRSIRMNDFLFSVMNTLHSDMGNLSMPVTDLRRGNLSHEIDDLTKVVSFIELMYNMLVGLNSTKNISILLNIPPELKNSFKLFDDYCG